MCRLEVQQDTNGEAGKENLAGLDVLTDIIEAVTGIDAVPVVDQAGDDTEVPLVGIEGIDAAISGRHLTRRSGRDCIARKGVVGSTIAAVDTEIPMEAVAANAARHETHTLEELEAHLLVSKAAGVNFVKTGRIGSEDGFEVVDRGIVEAIASGGDVETYTEAIDFAESTENADTDGPTG